MKKIIALSALALSLSLSQAPLAYADHMPCEFNGHHMAKMVEKLDLTTEQHAKIKAIRAAAKQKIEPIHREMHALRQKINDAFKMGDVSDSKQKSFVKDEVNLISSVLTIRMSERADISKLLTATQKTKLSSMVQKKMDKHHDKHD